MHYLIHCVYVRVTNTLFICFQQIYSKIGSLLSLSSMEIVIDPQLFSSDSGPNVLIILFDYRLLNFICQFLSLTIMKLTTYHFCKDILTIPQYLLHNLESNPQILPVIILHTAELSFHAWNRILLL